MGAKSDIVKKALKLVEEHIAPGTEQYAKNLDAFYGATHPNYRQKYYTGTSKDKDFTAFQESRHGTWLTNNPSEASSYATDNDSQNYVFDRGQYRKTNTASRVIPSYARVENPYTGELPDFAKTENYKKAQSDWFDKLRAQGYDAWAPDTNKGDLLVVLKDQGTNVKSAIGNNGQFDRSKKHLAKAGGGLVEDALRLISEGLGDRLVKKTLSEKYYPPGSQEYQQNLSRFLNGSKLVDDAGNPIRLYHQTPGDFDTFKMPEGIGNTSGPAIWMTDNPENIPSGHNTSGSRAEGTQYREGTNVMPVYARMKNPLYVDRNNNDEYRELIKRFSNGDGAFPQLMTKEWRGRVLDAGHDGIVFKNRAPFPNEYIALDPEQVKSAIGNRGTFWPNHDRITKAGGGLIDDAVRLATKAVEGDVAPAVPKLFGEGHKVGIHPQADDYTRKLGAYLNARNPDMPIDPKSIAERRQDMGFNVDAYHGSPRDIHQFSNTFSTPEGYWGGHHYATSSPLDASVNYATRNGADLVNRLGSTQEEILNGFHPDDVRQWYEEKYGKPLEGDPTDSQLVNEWSQDAAADALGITNHGAVYPVALRMKNPVRIDSPNQTFWEHVIEQDDNGDIISEGGPAADLLQHTQDTMREYGLGDSEIADVIGRLNDELYGSGGIDAGTYDALMRKYAIYGTDDSGNMVSPGHIMSDVFQRMGHDSIDMPTDVFAPSRFKNGMQGTGGDTRHYIVFDPKNIRSRFGLFDPFKANSTRLSDARGGRVGKAGGGSLVDEAMKIIRAYHGSPHDFSKFEWSPRVRGTGEGAQAYGDGLYFADREDVARGYRDKLGAHSNPALRIGDYMFNVSKGGNKPGSQEDALYRLWKARLGFMIDNPGAKWDADLTNGTLDDVVLGQMRPGKELVDWANSTIRDKDIEIPNAGHMYAVDLKAAPGQLLNWDAPLHQQPEAIKRMMPSLDEARGVDADVTALAEKVLKDRGNDELQAQWDAAYHDPVFKRARIVVNDANPNMRGLGARGEDIYRALAPTAPEASKILMDAGVPGLKFLDGLSRTAGEGTSNYTIFNPDIIDIKKKYAEGGEVRDGYATKGAVLKKALSVAEDVIGGRTPTEVFPDLANRYPEVGPPEWKIDKKKGEGYWAKKLTPEALAVQKARKAIQADIDKGNYSPFFDPAKRADVDPTYYPAVGSTVVDQMPVKPETQAKWRAKAFNPEGLDRLRKGYEEGLKQKGVSENWYFMKQLEDEFIKELGPEEGRKQFKERFAKAMATTTGGADPTDNLIMAYYGNWMANKGEAIPETNQMPFPIGGRYVGGNMEMFEKNIGKDLTTDNPKRFNFQNNFLGHKQPTVDEQMSRGFDPKLNMPEWYGPYEEAINHLAAEYKVDPRYFQEVGWAGLKSMTPEGYKGKPMIAHVNEAIERTSRITGVPPAEVVRRGLVRGEMPIYGLAAPAAGAVAVGAMDDEDPADEAARIAKAGGGAFKAAVENLLGKAEREGVGALTAPGSGYASVPGKPATVLLPGIGRVEAKPLSPVMEAVRSYMDARGLPGAHDIEAFPEFDPELAVRIAREYDKMPHAPRDPAVKRSFDAMAQETLDQLKAAKDTGIDFRAIRGDDPYGASPGIGYADIAERGNLHFFPTDSGFGSSNFDPAENPLLKRVGRIGDLDNATINDAFRIVHDLYGHYGPGNPFFRAPGEERAFKLHSRMYSPEALPAMASETRGQNSWLNYGPHGERNRSALGADTIFADQKTGLMPAWTYDWQGRIGKAGGGGLTPYADAPEFAWRARFAADNPGSPEVNEMVTSITDDELKRQFDEADAWQRGQDYLDRNGMGNRASPQGEITSRPSTIRESVYGSLPSDMARNVATSMAPIGDAANFLTGAEDFGNAWYKFAQTGETPSMEDRAWMAVNMAPAVVGAAAKPVWNAAKSAFRAVPDVVKGGLAGAGALTAMPDEAEAGKLNLFSRLGTSIENLPMDKMTSEQALALLAKTAPGSELKWTRTLDYLRDNPKVTKSGLLAHLEANKVEPHETALGEGVVYPHQLSPRPEIRAKYADELQKARSEATWYGLSGRREDKDRSFEAQKRVWDIEKKMRDEELAALGGYAPAPRYEGWNSGDFNTDSYREHVLTLPGTPYVSRHYGKTPNAPAIPGYIAHMRGGMRSEDGKRIYIMDEAQSDLAQDLRKYGEITPNDVRVAENAPGDWGVYLPNNGYLGGYGSEDIARGVANKKMRQFTPYTDNTDDWTDLAVKRALMAAQEGDATHIAWPGGRAQNDRYDMRHQMNALHYTANRDGTYNVAVETPNQEMQDVLDGVSADEVRRAVGEDIWRRMQANEGHLDDFLPNTRRLPMNGEVLENKGLNKFYDEIVPKRFSAVAKKATGEKVNIGKQEIVNRNGLHDYHIMPLTSGLRSAKFSSFERGGTVERALALVNED